MGDLLARDDPEAAARAIEVLRDGELVVVPTDTVYAVVADAFAGFATRRLLGAKHRGRELPLSLLLRNPRQVIGLARETPESAERLMAAYWPGPLSLLLPVQPDMPWDLGAIADVIGLRMPADDFVLDLVAEIGPLACSGANRRGDPLPTTVEEARRQLGEAISLYVDGGTLEGPPSTIVDCSRGTAQVLRQGAIATDDVRRVADGELPWGTAPQDASEAAGAPPGGASPAEASPAEASAADVAATDGRR